MLSLWGCVEGDLRPVHAVVLAMDQQSYENVGDVEGNRPQAS